MGGVMTSNKLSPEALEFFRAQGAAGGRIGGKKAAEGMTPEQRQERARKGGVAAAARRAQRDLEKAAEAGAAPAEAPTALRRTRK